jgi:iron complex transport system substrate-binding protein
MKKALGIYIGVAVLCACLGWAGVRAATELVHHGNTKIVADSGGHSVVIPREVKRIAVTCYGGASQEIAVLEAGDKIVAQPSMSKFPLLLSLYPKFRSIPDVGSFDNVSIEQLMMVRPDLVIAAVISPHSNAQIKSMGLPVVEVLVGRADSEGLLSEIAMMGQVLNKKSQAAELINYWHSRMAWIKQRTAKIPASQRRKVLYMSTGNSVSQVLSNGWGHEFIVRSGGEDVVSGIKATGTLNTEQLIAWNPDVIVINGSARQSALLNNNPQLRKINAVSHHAIYYCPIGAFWWDRPSPEAILGVMWLAKTLYPEQMKNLNLRSETFSFYRRFYRHELSNSEYEAMLNPGTHRLRQ